MAFKKLRCAPQQVPVSLAVRANMRPYTFIISLRAKHPKGDLAHKELYKGKWTTLAKRNQQEVYYPLEVIGF